MQLRIFFLVLWQSVVSMQYGIVVIALNLLPVQNAAGHQPHWSPRRNRWTAVLCCGSWFLLAARLQRISSSSVHVDLSISGSNRHSIHKHLNILQFHPVNWELDRCLADISTIHHSWFSIVIRLHSIFTLRFCYKSKICFIVFAYLFRALNDACKLSLYRDLTKQNVRLNSLIVSLSADTDIVNIDMAMTPESLPLGASLLLYSCSWYTSWRPQSVHQAWSEYGQTMILWFYVSVTDRIWLHVGAAILLIQRRWFFIFRRSTARSA